MIVSAFRYEQARVIERLFDNDRIRVLLDRHDQNVFQPNAFVIRFLRNVIGAKIKRVIVFLKTKDSVADPSADNRNVTPASRTAEFTFKVSRKFSVNWKCVLPFGCFTTERHPEFDGQCFTGKTASYVCPLCINASISKAAQSV